MATPVVTVASGGLPVVDVTATAPKLGAPVTEALAGRGTAVTKVAAGGLPVTYSTVADYPPSGGGGPFTPANLTGLIGWWDASVFASLTLSSGKVVSWADQSGAGNTMLGAGSPTPAYNATGFNTSYPAVVTTSGQNNLNTAANFSSIGTGNTLTIWHVGTAAAAGSSSDAVAMALLGPGQSAAWNNATSFSLGRNSGANEISLTRNGGYVVSTLSASPVPYRIIVTISAAGATALYVNGVVTNGSATSGNWGAGTSQLFLHWYGNYWAGPIAEAGIATGFSNAATVGQLDTYLKNKWGL